MPLSTSDQIAIGRLSAVYTSNEIDSGQRQGGVIDPRLPILQYMVTEGLEMLYDLDPTHIDLVPIGNYLISICRHQFKAEAVLDLDNGGTVAPIASNIPPNDIDFIVSDFSLMVTGDTSIFLDGIGGNPDLRGYNIDFFRSGQPQYTTEQPGGGMYYSWNNVTGLLQLLPLTTAEATEGEPFRISPKTGGGSIAISPSDVFPIVLTGADFEVDGITYINRGIVGYEYMLTVIGYNQEPQFEPDFFEYNANGFEITASGFDVNNYPRIIINRINP